MIALKGNSQAVIYFHIHLFINRAEKLFVFKYFVGMLNNENNLHQNKLFLPQKSKTMVIALVAVNHHEIQLKHAFYPV